MHHPLIIAPIGARRQALLTERLPGRRQAHRCSWVVGQESLRGYSRANAGLHKAAVPTGPRDIRKEPRYRRRDASAPRRFGAAGIRRLVGCSTRVAALPELYPFRVAAVSSPALSSVTRAATVNSRRG